MSEDPFNTDSDRLCRIIDSLPKAHEMIVREWPDDYPGTYASWADSVGHPIGSTGRCRTCGLAITCPLRALWDALVSSVVRELDKRYRITQRGPGRHLCVCADSVYRGRTCPSPDGRNGCPREGESGKTFRQRVMEKYAHLPWAEDPADLPDEEPNLDHEDTCFLFGSAPSYRCYVSRHEDCENGPGQPEDGCTCACHGGPREQHCGAIGDHGPHSDCWGSGPFRKDQRREWLTQKREEAGLCICNSREIDGQGRRVHYIDCPQDRPGPDLKDWCSPEDAVYDLEVEDPAESPQFTSEGCTCVPYKVVDGQPVRMTNEPIDQVSRWDMTGCPLHAPCGWFTDPNGVRRHGIEQGKKGSTDFVRCPQRHKR